MNEPWPPPGAPDLSGAFKKAHDNEKEAPPKEAGRLTDAPRQILVPPGISRSAAPPLPGLGSPPPQKAEEQRMARIARMQQELKARDDTGRGDQREQSR
jgi:hypothetical protein